MKETYNMRKMHSLWLVAVLATTSASLFSVSMSAAAQPATSMDCTQAEAMLNTAVSNKAATITTGDVDKDFATLMMLHEKVGKRINEIEAQCGKDPKMQAMAATGSEDTQRRIDLFRNGNTSQ